MYIHIYTYTNTPLPESTVLKLKTTTLPAGNIASPAAKAWSWDPDR